MSLSVEVQIRSICQECGEVLVCSVSKANEFTTLIDVEVVPCKNCVDQLVEQAQECTCDGTEAKRGGLHYKDCPSPGEKM